MIRKINDLQLEFAVRTPKGEMSRNPGNISANVGWITRRIFSALNTDNVPIGIIQPVAPMIDFADDRRIRLTA